MVRRIRCRRAARACLAGALGLALALCANAAHAANLELGEAIRTGDVIAVPVLIASTNLETVASLQFDLRYATSMVELVDIAAGAQATEAVKMTEFRPYAAGARVVVAGFNQTRIADGEVATVYLRLRDADASLDDLDMASIVFSDPQGNQIPVATPAVQTPEKTREQSGSSPADEWQKLDPNEEESAPAADTPEATAVDADSVPVAAVYPGWPSEDPPREEIDTGSHAAGLEVRREAILAIAGTSGQRAQAAAPSSPFFNNGGASTSPVSSPASGPVPETPVMSGAFPGDMTPPQDDPAQRHAEQGGPSARLLLAAAPHRALANTAGGAGPNLPSAATGGRHPRSGLYELGAFALALVVLLAAIFTVRYLVLGGAATRGIRAQRR